VGRKLNLIQIALAGMFTGAMIAGVILLIIFTVKQ